MENRILLCKVPDTSMYFCIYQAICTKQTGDRSIELRVSGHKNLGKPPGKVGSLGPFSFWGTLGRVCFAASAADYTKFFILHRHGEAGTLVGKGAAVLVSGAYEQVFHTLLRTHVEKSVLWLSTWEKAREIVGILSFLAARPHTIHSVPTPLYAVSTSC